MKSKFFYPGLLILVSLIACSGPSFDAAAETAAIEKMMKDSEAAWNNGNLETFMTDYVNRDDLRFVGSQIAYGYDATLARYKKGYPDRAAMGHLSFSELDVRILSAEFAFVFGQYTLHRENDMPTGFFTLLMEKHDGRWLIAHDHSSPQGKSEDTEKDL